MFLYHLAIYLLTLSAVSSSSSARPGYGHVNLRDTNNNVPEETVHISVLKDETDEDSDEEVGEIEHSGRGKYICIKYR